MRSAREAARLSLEQAGEELRIEPKYLAALEEERYDAIGVPVFAKGYLKLYCEYLGLDYARLLPLYEEKAGKQTPPLKGRQSVGRREGPGSGLWRLAGLGVVVLALFALWWVRPGVKPSGPGETEEAPTVPAPAVPEPAVPEPTASPPTGIAPGAGSASQSDAGANDLGGAGHEAAGGHQARAPAASEASPRASESSAREPSGEPGALRAGAEAEATAAAPGAPPSTGPAPTASGDDGAQRRTASGGDVTQRSTAAGGLAVELTVPPGPAVPGEPEEPRDGAPSLAVDLMFLQDSWVEVTDSNKTRLYYGLGKAGEESHVAGEPPLAVLIGNADGVVLEVDGKPYAFPRRRTGKVAYFTLKAPAE